MSKGFTYEFIESIAQIIRFSWRGMPTDCFEILEEPKVGFKNHYN